MKYLFTIISFLFCFCIKAQTANVKSVEQKGQQIYITYDLQGSPGKYEIKLLVKKKNSYSWSSALKSVTGNVGLNQSLGSNKQIIWDVLQDRDQFQGDWVFGIKAVNITEKQKEEKRALKQAKKEKKMNPKSQIGYLTNFTAHPFGGINYFNFKKKLGFYIDARPTFSYWHDLNRSNTSLTGNSNQNYIIWTSIYNLGISTPFMKFKKNILIAYAGLGQSISRLYSRVYSNSFNEYWYYENGLKLNRFNLNFGIIQQSNSKISWQIGFDNAIKNLYNSPYTIFSTGLNVGLNFGIGIKIG